MLEFKNIGNRISQAIFDASFYKDVGCPGVYRPKNGQFRASLDLKSARAGYEITSVRLREIG
jgi:hypothetical protein